MTEQTDVVVLGVGTCGEDVALRLLAAGLDVVGIEARLVGGECPYFACLPTKAMVRSANLLQEARRADGLVGRVEVRADWSLVAARVRNEITGGWDDATAVERFGRMGGRFVRGRGVLTGPRTVGVDGREFAARRGVVIATGSRPLIPPIPGLGDVAPWTTRDAIRAAELPESLLVLGGGAVGCEIGQIFARFGARVTIVEAADRILPAEEPVASEVVAAALAEDGISLVTGARVASVRPAAASVVAVLDSGDEIAAERLMLATGRVVDTDGLGLAAAGVGVDGGFIRVDDRMRAAPGVWAIGDVTGVGMFTHVALHQATVAVAGLLGADPAPADYRAVPRVTFTDPEVGAVGMTEAQARSAGNDVTVAVKHVPATFRGWLHRAGNAGVLKLVVDSRSGRLLGATSVGPNGGEVLGMLALAVTTGATARDLAGVMYAFPTFHGGVGEALGAYARGIGRVLDPEGAPLFTDEVP